MNEIEMAKAQRGLRAEEGCLWHWGFHQKAESEMAYQLQVKWQPNLFVTFNIMKSFLDFL